MSRPGDWNCRSCQHLNFQRREMCQRCGDPKNSSEFGSMMNGNGRAIGYGGSDVRPGDWYCSIANCGAHNFASRSTCFKCGAFKDDVVIGGGIDFEFSRSRNSFGFGNGGRAGAGASAWKSGDWICARSGCNEHNFASRMECFRCSAPRDSY